MQALTRGLDNQQPPRTLQVPWGTPLAPGPTAYSLKAMTRSNPSLTADGTWKCM